MGFTSVKVDLYNPADSEKTAKVNVLIDRGALSTSVPAQVAETLGLKPVERRRLRVYAGTVIERDTGVAGIEYEGHRAGVTIIFGEPQDTPVLGVTALESLGYELYPATRKLRPAELLML